MSESREPLPPSRFEELETILQQAGPVAALSHAADVLLHAGRRREAFSARLTAERLRLGLPVTSEDGWDELPEPLRSRLEEAYTNVCRSVGAAALAADQPREAWSYLRAAGDRAALTAYLEKNEPPPDTTDEWIELAIYEGLAPDRGFEWLLARYGLCQAITTHDAAAGNLPRGARVAIVTRLLLHLHESLVENLKRDIVQREGQPPAPGTIAEWMTDRAWLSDELSYHVDTSHLAAVVRMARGLELPEVLRIAIDLTEYGRRLHPQLQLAGEEPFVDLYPSQGLYFRGLLGEQLSEALAYFGEKARAIPAIEQGPLPAEVYVTLLDRAGRHVEAWAAREELLPSDVPTTGLAPSRRELAARGGCWEAFRKTALEQDDLVEFAWGWIAERDS